MINIFYICKLSNFPLDLAISVEMCKKDLESASPVPIFKCAVMTLKLHRHLSISAIAKVAYQLTKECIHSEYKQLMTVNIP